MFDIQLHCNFVVIHDKRVFIHCLNIGVGVEFADIDPYLITLTS